MHSPALSQRSTPVRFISMVHPKPRKELGSTGNIPAITGKLSCSLECAGKRPSDKVSIFETSQCMRNEREKGTFLGQGKDFCWKKECHRIRPIGQKGNSLFVNIRFKATVLVNMKRGSSFLRASHRKALNALNDFLTSGLSTGRKTTLPYEKHFQNFRLFWHKKKDILF